MRYNIILKMAMENHPHLPYCTACRDIQQLVYTNEQIVQQQIVLIKQLHTENTQLNIYNQQLTQQLQQRTLQLEQLSKRSKPERIDQGQQTEWSFDQNHETEIQKVGETEKELKVSTKVNMKTAESSRKSSLNSVNKENLREMLPIVNMNKNEEYFSRKRKNSFEEEQQAPSWLKIIDSGATQPPLKFKQKTAHLAKKMIPHEIRHIVWPAVCQDELHLTDSFYCELQERQATGWVSKEVKAQIEKDIVRSFSARNTLEDKERLKLEVTEVLEMFHLYRPDISYVQGMTYPIIVLTIIVGKVKAFRIFANLVLTNPFFRQLYMFEPNFVQAVSRTFQMLLFDYQSEIAQKLAKLKIDSQIFLVEWFYTIFSRSLTFEGTVKFWDQFLYHGEVVLFRMALAIFELIKSYIMETNFEDTVGLIQGFGSYIRQEKLFDLVVHSKVSDQKVQRYLQKTLRLLRSQNRH